MEKVVSSKLYGLGHVLSKIELYTTPTSCMQQCFMGVLHVLSQVA